MNATKEDIEGLLKKLKLAYSDQHVDLMLAECRSKNATKEELDETYYFMEGEIVNGGYAEMNNTLFKGWSKRLAGLTTVNAKDREKKAEEEKKGLLEYVWEQLPSPKLSGNTYVKFNEKLPKIAGRENGISKLWLKANPKLTLSDYKFLYYSHFAQKIRFQSHAKKLAYRKAIKASIADRIIADNNLKDVPDFNLDTKDSRFIIGEIGNSDEESLSLDNVILINRDEDQSGAETKAVSLAEGLQNVSLFEGEIVALEGVTEHRRFIAERVLKPKPVQKRERKAGGDVSKGILQK